MKSVRRLGFALLLCAAFAITSQAEERGIFDRTLNVNGQVELEVISGSGNITVHAGASNNVHVTATIHAKDSWLGGGMSAKEKVQKLQSNPPIEQRGNSITIGRIEDHDLQHNVSIDYDVTVPVKTRLTSRTGSGDQHISGLKLPLTAKTGSGNITIADIDADARISSGSGDLTVNTIKGTLSAEAGSGNIRAQGIAGAITARTGSGRIELEQVASGDINVGTGSGNVRLRGVKGGLRAHTGSGDIDAEGELSHDWRLGAGSGNITLKLPSKASFNLDARTSSGTLKINRQVTMKGTMSHNHIEGKVRKGGVLLNVHTGSGDIEVD